MTAIGSTSTPPLPDFSANPPKWAMPVTECTRCGRPVRAYVPRHGDGSALVTYWHKDPRDKAKWCRSEVDEADYPDQAEYYLYRRSMEMG